MNDTIIKEQFKRHQLQVLGFAPPKTHIKVMGGVWRHGDNYSVNMSINGTLWHAQMYEGSYFARRLG
jgi:tryptophan synthase alpha subunit